jgi:hypothetical protein
VTPWAARALDRSLAATVVSAVRHLDGKLTPEPAVTTLQAHLNVAIAVRDALVARAPDDAVAGGRAAFASLIDTLIDAWTSTADDQSAGGNEFVYARKKSPNRLLHMPLEAGLDNLSPEHRLFVAGRSMRDVEPSVMLRVRDPQGRPIANADDLT